MALVHRHVWSLKDTRAVEITSTDDPYPVIGHQTEVLYGCLRCTKVKAKTIKGRWTREQLR